MFNPQARWDRKLPTSSKRETEKVEVVARFHGGNFEPLYFSTGPYQHKISHINYRWVERKGKNLLYYFSVSDEVDNLCLYLSTQTMSWRLVHLE